jgi:CHAT domain-containing protein
VRRRGDVASQALTFRPGQGRLVEISWTDARPPGGLQTEAARIREDAETAIARLSRAVQLAPSNPIVWSDLAAARLQRGATFTDPYDFFQGLIAANRALRLASDLPEAQFNRALALQRVSLFARARTEWELYLDDERDPDWVRAAKTHAAAADRMLRRPPSGDHLRAFELAVERGDRRAVQTVVEGAPQLLREHGEQALLTAWAEAEARQDEREARRSWEGLRLLGEALSARGEHMLADTVSHIEDIHGDEKGRARMVEAVRAYGQGVSHVFQWNLAGCLSAMETSLEGLDALRSPLAGWTTYWMANCHYQRFEYAKALDRLRSLTGERYRERYPALHGRASSLIGLIQTIQGDPTASMTAYRAAVADFRRLGETAYASRMASLFASSLDALGRPVEAWRRLYPALVDPAAYETPVARELIALVAGWLANGAGEREIALWFQEEVVRNAEATGQPSRIVEALRGRGEIQALLGDRAGAAETLAQAKKHLAKIDEPAAQELLKGDLKMAEAELSASPEEAVGLLDEVVRIYHSSQYQYRLAQAYFARARALEALGRNDKAEEDFAAAITEFEMQRERIQALEERISYFDRTRELLDAMIRFQLERRRRPEAAFAYSERAKARVLLDWVVARQSGGITPEQIQPTTPTATDPASLQPDLPANTTVLEYWALPDRLVIWVLRRDDFRIETENVGSKTLENLVQRLARELHSGRREDFLNTSSRLYDVLIRPVARHLPPHDRMVFVPDGALHGLPFAALWDGRKFLAEERICSVAPSTRILTTSLKRDSELASSGAPRALVVSDPAFDTRLFPLLSRLKAAKREKEFAEIFEGSRVLGDRSATRSDFLEQAGEFEIIHFGGHSLVNPEYPLYSQMLFASDENDGTHGVLYSGDILGRHFQQTRLAVLASCSTAVGRISSTEGVESLARPFLAAGVPAVVASLWDVDDEVTAEFFSRFYGHLRENFDPAEALQKTQNDFLKEKSTDLADPRAWGAFELIGGSAQGAAQR